MGEYSKLKDNVEHLHSTASDMPLPRSTAAAFIDQTPP